MKPCLVLIDLQNDYFPGGKLEVTDIDAAAENARMLLEAFRGASLPVVHVRHLSTRPGAAFLLPETHGSEIHESVAPQGEEPVIVKNYPNSFRETRLLEFLKEREIGGLVICGAMSQMCIDATTRAAFDLGFGCVVAADACAARDMTFGGRTVPATDVHCAFMAALAAVYADVVRTEEILAGFR
jgi:nicotinamidase-related amidase